MSKKENKENDVKETKDEKLEEVVAETIPEPEIEVEAENVDADKEVDVDFSSECDTLKEQLADKDKEIADLKDRLLRQAAETENYKKRLIRDKEEAVKFANSALIKDLLGPIDDFKRAIEASEKTKDYDAMHDGIKMIDDSLYSLLKNNWGLEEIGVEGEDFDANMHEACMLVPDETIDHEIVKAVFQKGYRLHGRVLRAAKVQVAKPTN